VEMRLSQILLAVFLFITPAIALGQDKTFIPSVQVTISGEAGKPVIKGTSNLPENTEVMVELVRKASSYQAQDKAVVNKGSFSAGPFSQRNNPLNDGTYRVIVRVTPMGQIDAVKRLFGSRGELLAGENVRDGSITIAEFEDTFTVGAQPSKEADAQAVKDAERAMKQWTRESCRSLYGANKAKVDDCVLDVSGK